jgi:hypothetical protein
MDFARRLLRRLGYSGWVLLSVVLALIAGAGLADAITHPTYDPHENRAPEARIALAAVALAVGLAAVSVPVQRLRGKHGRVGLTAGLILTLTTLLLIFLLVIVDIASGPL